MSLPALALAVVGAGGFALVGPWSDALVWRFVGGGFAAAVLVLFVHVSVYLDIRTGGESTKQLERLSTFYVDYVGAFNAVFYALLVPILIATASIAQQNSRALAYTVAVVAILVLGSVVHASQSALGRGRMRRLLSHRYLPFVVTYFIANGLGLVIVIVYVMTNGSSPSEQYPAMASALALCTTFILTFGATVSFQNLREVQSKADREIQPVLVDDQVEVHSFASVGPQHESWWSLRCRNVGSGSAVVVVVERDGTITHEQSVVTREQEFWLRISDEGDRHNVEPKLPPVEWKLRVWCRSVATGHHQEFEIMGRRLDVGIFGFSEGNWTLNNDGRDRNGRLVDGGGH